METTLTRVVAVAPRLARVKGLTREDFDEIVRLHQRRIYRVLLALVRDPDAADTLTQECFLRAYRKRASFRGESSVHTWLVRIAVNLATDHSKSRRQAFWRRLVGGTKAGNMAHDAAFAVDDLVEPHASPERVLVAREKVKAVWSIVEELSAQQRAIFLLRFAEEMTLEEIAQALEVELGTVKSHLFRAVGHVRQRLQEQGQK